MNEHDGTPDSQAMKPKPFVPLNHLTVPFGIQYLQ
jgi:hypothetical protein